MRSRWLAVIAMTLLVGATAYSSALSASGGGSGGQEAAPFMEEIITLREQQAAMRAQSLALIERVKALLEDRRQLLEERTALKDALAERQRASRTRAEAMEDKIVTLRVKMKALKADRRRLMTDQAVAQKMAKALDRRVGRLQKRLDQVEAELREEKPALRAERRRLKEAAKKIRRLERALEGAKQDNIDLQLRVTEFQSLVREARLAFNYELGLAHRKNGDYEAAIGEFQRTLELDPHFAEAHLQLGEIYREHLKRADIASPFFRRYLELRPEAGNLEQIKGWLIKSQKEIETREAAKQWGGGFFRNLGRIFR